MVTYKLCFKHVCYHSEINKTEVLLIYFANKRVNHRHRDSSRLPKVCFPICLGRYQSLLAQKPTKPAKQNYGGYCCLPIFSVGKTQKSVNVTDSSREILLSGAWISQESFIDSWITLHDVKPLIKPSRFFLAFFGTYKKENVRQLKYDSY